MISFLFFRASSYFPFFSPSSTSFSYEAIIKDIEASLEKLPHFYFFGPRHISLDLLYLPPLSINKLLLYRAFSRRTASPPIMHSPFSAPAQPSAPTYLLLDFCVEQHLFPDSPSFCVRSGLRLIFPSSHQISLASCLLALVSFACLSCSLAPFLFFVSPVFGTGLSGGGTVSALAHVCRG